MSGSERLWTLFHDLVDLAPAAREAHLATLDEGTRVRERLRAMLATEVDGAPMDSEGARRAFPWPGDPVGAYQLIAPIGDGGMGSVWLATSRTAPTVSVAIKFPALGSPEAADTHARLVQEGRVLACLDHPNIVALVDAGETEAGLPYCVLRAVRGRAFDEFVRQRRLDVESIVELLVSLAAALDHVHERGFVHRDVKPSNVLVSEQDWPVLVDFGAARVTETAAIVASAVTVTHAPRTPGFASPEQEREEEATVASDVYGLGALARVALAAPLHDASAKTRRAAERVLERALDPEPSRRFASAGELAAALRGVIRPAPAVGRASVMRAVGAALLIGVFALGAATGPWWWGRSSAAQGPDGRLVATLADALAEVPAADIHIDYKTLAAIAEQRDAPGLRVAAALAGAESGEVDFARKTALATLAQGVDLPLVRSIELAELATRMGRCSAALEAVDGVHSELLPYDQQMDVMLLRGLNRSRAGEWGAFAGLSALAEDWDELSDELLEPRHDVHLVDDELSLHGGEPALCLGLLLLARGAPELVATWFEVRQRDEATLPLECPTSELGALLELHARLLDAGQSGPLSDAFLRDVELEIGHRHEEAPELLPIRAWCWARQLRIRGTLGRDPSRAVALAAAGLARVEQSVWAPRDLEARLQALHAAAIHRAQGAAAAVSFRGAAEAAAREACGEGSGLVELVAAMASSAGPDAPRLTDDFDRPALATLMGLLRAQGADAPAAGPWWRVSR
ncbi:MAG: serine/threonine-protein kinase [Planctomycetota bacterium]